MSADVQADLLSSKGVMAAERARGFHIFCRRSIRRYNAITSVAKAEKFVEISSNARSSKS